MKFKIYYGDGSTFSGKAEDAPMTDVQIVTQEHYVKNDAGELVHTFKIIHNKSAYFWDTKSETWFATDRLGFYDLLYNMPNPKTMIFGRTIADDQFRVILKRAIKEGIN